MLFNLPKMHDPLRKVGVALRGPNHPTSTVTVVDGVLGPSTASGVACFVGTRETEDRQNADACL